MLNSKPCTGGIQPVRFISELFFFHPDDVTHLLYDTGSKECHLTVGVAKLNMSRVLIDAALLFICAST